MEITESMMIRSTPSLHIPESVLIPNSNSFHNTSGDNRRIFNFSGDGVKSLTECAKFRPIICSVTNSVSGFDSLVRYQSIVFMKQFKNKSFEELRVEDYLVRRITDFTLLEKSGTRQVKFSPVTDSESTIVCGKEYLTLTRYQCIVIMDVYKNKSFEELRYEDNLVGSERKGRPLSSSRTVGIISLSKAGSGDLTASHSFNSSTSCPCCGFGPLGGFETKEGFSGGVNTNCPLPEEDFGKITSTSFEDKKLPAFNFSKPTTLFTSFENEYTSFPSIGNNYQKNNSLDKSDGRSGLEAKPSTVWSSFGSSIMSFNTMSSTVSPPSNKVQDNILKFQVIYENHPNKESIIEHDTIETIENSTLSDDVKTTPTFIFRSPLTVFSVTPSLDSRNKRRNSVSKPAECQQDDVSLPIGDIQPTFVFREPTLVRYVPKKLPDTHIRQDSTCLKSVHEVLKLFLVKRKNLNNSNSSYLTKRNNDKFLKIKPIEQLLIKSYINEGKAMEVGRNDGPFNSVKKSVELHPTLFVDKTDSGNRKLEENLAKIKEENILEENNNPVIESNKVIGSFEAVTMEESSKRGNFRCYKCKFDTNKAGDIMRHLSNVHQSLHIFRCNTCSFSTPIHKKFKYHICNSKASRISFSEMMNLQDRKLHCPKCSYITNIPNKMMSHSKQSHKDLFLFKCPACPFKDSDRFGYLDHGVTCSKIIQRSEFNLYNNGNDVKDIKKIDLDLGNNHIKTPLEPVSDPKVSKQSSVCCSRCPYSSVHPENIKLHFQKVHKSAHMFSCDKCNLSSTNNRSVTSHICNKVRRLSTCPHCDFTSRQQRLMMRHVKTQHGSQPCLRCGSHHVTPCGYKVDVTCWWSGCPSPSGHVRNLHLPKSYVDFRNIVEKSGLGDSVVKPSKKLQLKNK